MGAFTAVNESTRLMGSVSEDIQGVNSASDAVEKRISEFVPRREHDNQIDELREKLKLLLEEVGILRLRIDESEDEPNSSNSEPNESDGSSSAPNESNSVD